MTDVDGLHGSFLAIDENGQRLFAITSTDGTAQKAGVTVVTLAKVPLGIGTLTPANGPAGGGTQLNDSRQRLSKRRHRLHRRENRRRHFQRHEHANVVTPALTAGAQRVSITNPDGETISLDAASPPINSVLRRGTACCAQLARAYKSTFFLASYRFRQILP